MRRNFLIALSLITIVLGVTTAVFFASYPLRHRAEIRAAADRFQIEPDLIASIIRAESGFRPSAVSKAGAIGLMQIMPATAEWKARRLGMTITEADIFDPATNITIGTAYLRYLLDKFGDVTTALIAYNAGQGRVTGWLSNPDYSKEVDNGTRILKRSPFPETNAYVSRVRGARWIYRIRL